MITKQREDDKNVNDLRLESGDKPMILLGGGDLNRAAFDEITAHGYPLVAADGGANALLDTDPVPDLIIGDLDSLADRAGWQDKTTVIEVSEQETTDFEKCLIATSAPLYLGFGFLGKRFDHSLAALHVLARYAGTKRIVLIGDNDIVFVPTAPFEAAREIGSRFSVYPIGQVTFEASTGLKYPLDGLTLAPGVAVGTSNEVTESPVRIVPDAASDGQYAVILPTEALPNIISDIAS